MTPEIYRSLAQGILGQTAPASDISANRPEMQMAQDQLNKLPLSNEAVTQAGPAVADAERSELLKQQAAQALAQVNTRRAQSGQPPLDPQQVAQAQQTAVSSASPTNPDWGALQPPDESALNTSPDGFQRDATGTPLTPQALLQDATNKRDADLGASHHLGAMQRTAAADEAKVNLDTAHASQKPEDALHARIEENYNNLHAVQAEVDSQAKAAIADYNTVQADMKKMAQAAPQDIWGQSGVNQIVGAASIFFGGSGYSGNHANRNLDLINNLAERNVAAQKAKFDQLERVGQGDKTIYGMLQQRLQNSQAVSGTLKNMAMESYLSSLRTIANQYADPKWKAAVEQQASKIYGEQMSRDQAVSKTYIDESQRALQLIGAEKARQTIADAADVKQKQTELTHGIGGYKGYMPNSAEHGKVAEMVAGGRGMILGANHVASALHTNMTVGEYRKLLVNYAIHFAAARKFLQTGTRIEAGEQKILDALNILPQEALMTSLSRADIAGLQEKLDAVRSLITEGVDATVYSYAPGTMQPDPNDRVFGPWRNKENSVFSDQTGALPSQEWDESKDGASMMAGLPNANGSKAEPAQAVPGGY